MTLNEALFRLVIRPVDLVVRRWNWKAAFFSSLIRGFIFLLANPAAGWRAAAGAMLFLVHWLRHTPHLKTSIISSISFTVVSTLFNFYAMRRGTMVVGRNCPSLAQDVRAMPAVIGGFLAVFPLWIWRSLRSGEAA